MTTNPGLTRASAFPPLSLALLALLASPHASLLARGEPAPSEIASAAAAPAATAVEAAWSLGATSLALLLILPGFALHFAGRIRQRNVAAILAQCVAICALTSMLWIAFGYSLAFTHTRAHTDTLLGGVSRLFLCGIERGAPAGGALPESALVAREMVMALFAATLLAGAFAERVRFPAALVFVSLWFTLAYLPICHMTRGDGLLERWGVIDSAGGMTIHLAAGTAALVIAALAGARDGFPSSTLRPHNLPLSMAGAGLVWAGWLALHAGGAGAADGRAATVLLTSQTAASTSALVWLFCDRVGRGRPGALGLATGAMVGLVAVAPCAGSVGPPGAMVVGASASVLCRIASWFCRRLLRLDDSLDIFVVHGIGGIIGTALTGICLAGFLGGEGLSAERGPLAQTLRQGIGVLVVFGWSGIVSLFAMVLASVLFRLRVSPEEEAVGFDLTQHRERGYDLG